MKTKASPTLDPNAAFPDETSTPTDDQLKSALGPAFTPVATILTGLREACPDVTSAWQYSHQAGWYRLALLKKRRVFYLVPQHRGFRLSLILGGKALAALKAGPRASEVTRLLKTARRYPEGTSFSFDATTCDPALVGALVAAKLAF